MLEQEPGSDYPGWHGQEAGMDAGLIVKPVTGVAISDYARPVAAAGQAVTPTDLPEAKAVTPLPDSRAPQNNAEHSKTSAATYISHDFVIDPQSREVIYRVMDMRTRQVLWQVPDAALLRNRAYAQTLNDSSTLGANKNVTDVTE
jgi:hypothetical protein